MQKLFSKLSASAGTSEEKWFSFSFFQIKTAADVRVKTELRHIISPVDSPTTDCDAIASPSPCLTIHRSTGCLLINGTLQTFTANLYCERVWKSDINILNAVPASQEKTLTGSRGKKNIIITLNQNGDIFIICCQDQRQPPRNNRGRSVATNLLIFFFFFKYFHC